MEREVAAPPGERREAAPVAPDRLQLERLAPGDEPVLRQLRRRVVEDRNPGSRRRQDRGLLPAAGGEAEDVGAHQLGNQALGTGLPFVSRTSHRPRRAASMTSGPPGAVHWSPRSTSLSHAPWLWPLTSN